MDYSALVNAMESYNKALSELREASMRAEFGTDITENWFQECEDSEGYIYVRSIEGCPHEGGGRKYFEFACLRVCVEGVNVSIRPSSLFLSNEEELRTRYVHLCCGAEDVLRSYIKPMVESLALSFGALIRPGE